MAPEVTRYDVNRQVRSVLVRHAVDLSRLGYSYSGRTVFFWGSLRKDHGGEFDLGTVEALVRDLYGLPYGQGLQFDLDDWTVSYEAGSLIIAKRKVLAASASPDALVIEKEERIEDVLREIEEQQAEK